MVKAVIFTDFDGTVTWQDSNDFLTDNKGFGKVEREKVFEGVLDGSKSFRDGFWEMLESVKTPFPECVKLLEQNIDLDPGFKDTYEWAQENGVPIVVISSGMRPLIRALLERLVGPEAIKNIEIVSNEVEIDDDGQWRIVYKDETPFGHDKSRSIKAYKKKFEADGEHPTYFYCGDGVSDLSAAKECDLLFAKRGKDLVTYCKRQDVPFHEFDTYEDILKSMKQVLAGEKTVKELMQN
ncbi:hypothetical protein ACU8KH_06119 [Lachancea thermotolerans]|uniref:KLTH0H11990p n=1 Tax=Lachancea thermotolerans (strain ATCC 56472 / CBS 6340 / NRRL Y-8284) TaxID=559295 RepID=C5E3B6_LACTC|nr:KLTH0H11990p [Lachancea thermotolerans CBS 6340]CAR30527.1 KLTH0H11990p [Lachancea thermotolerans CBS 6340]